MKRLAVYCIAMLAIMSMLVCCSDRSVSGKSGTNQSHAALKSGSSEKPVILVSIAPQKYFVEQVAGKELFEIVVIVPEGQSPHSYEPTPVQLSQMSKGVLWFTTGVEFETVLIPKLTAIAPSLTLVDTTIGISYRELEAHSHEEDDDHDENHEGEHHEEAGKDPHVWLGLSNVVIQTRIMSQALSALMPENQEQFTANQTEFSKRVLGLKAELETKAGMIQKKSVFVYHPAFGYLLDEIGFKQIPIEVGGKEPGAQHISEIISSMKQEGVRVIFVQKQFSSLSAKKIAGAIRGQVVELDPLAYDWENNIRLIYSTLLKLLQSTEK